MPVNAAVGDVFQLSVRGLMFNQRIMNTFHYGVSSMTGTPTVKQIADALDTKLMEVAGFIATYKAMLPPQWGLQSLWIQRLAPTRVAANKYAHLVLGTYPEDASTANLQGSFTRRGDLANRKNVGGIRIVIANRDPNNENGVLGAQQLDAMSAFLPFLVNDVNLTGIAVLKPILYGGGGILDVVPITFAEVQTTIRTQSRRTVGRGE